MRRFAVILLLVTIISAIGWWLLHWRATSGATSDPWRALPPNAAVIAEVPSPLTTLQRFTTTSQFWDDLERIPSWAALHTVLVRINEATDATLYGELDAHPMLVALEPRGEATGTLIIWPVAAESASIRTLGIALGADQASWMSLGRGEPITLRADSAWPALEMAWQNGLLFVSDRKDMVDEAVHRTGSVSAMVEDSLFTQARATFGGGSDAHLMLQPARCTRSITAWLPQEVRDAMRAPEGWAALDIRLRPGTVLMSGLLFAPAADASLSALAHQPAGKHNLTRVLPANVTALHTMRVDDAAQYVVDVNGTAPDTALFSTYGTWVRGTIGVAEARTEDDTLTHAWAVLQTEDPDRAVRALSAHCPNGMCDTSSYRGSKINKAVEHDALEALFGKPFSAFTQPLWVLLQDKVVFANSPADMRACIDAWTDGTSLALDARSGGFFREYASDAVTGQWIDVARALPLWRTRSTSAGQERMNALQPVLNNLGGCLVELTPQRPGVTEVSFCLQHVAATNAQAGSLWSASIGAPLEVPPFLLQDHLSRTMLVLAQDREHRISLISCTGKVLWQRQLDSTIMGEVHQLDRFKNGKLQMLFNTAKHVYLIDRNGKDVTGFPIALEQRASAPLSLFDYEGTKDYRVLQPLQDGHIANFGMEGRAIAGWAPAPSSTGVMAPVEHVRIKDKDYLIAVNRTGAVTVLDRSGAARYAAKLKLTSPTHVLVVRSGDEIGTALIIWVDRTNAVLSGTLDGVVDTLAAATTGIAQLIDPGDGTDAVARATSNTLVVTKGTTTLFTATLPDTKNNGAFPVAMGSTGYGIGVALPEREEIRLYRNDGTLWNGFPLKGASPFRVADINLDGALEVVTATNDGHVVAYSLPLASPR